LKNADENLGIELLAGGDAAKTEQPGKRCALFQWRR
jgi:hypothetical protein